MEHKAPPQKTDAPTCHDCGRFGTPHCLTNTPQATCNAFLPWSTVWQREMAAIKRAQRATYIVAIVVAGLAIVVMLIPA